MGEAGLSANLMSLAGLAVGIGMMVDGAVVMVENAFRIMAERKQSGEVVDKTSAVLAAAREVANPIAFAILIIVVVFLPLFALQGLEGKLFKPMGIYDQLCDGGLVVADPDSHTGSCSPDTQTRGRTRHGAGKGPEKTLSAAARMEPVKQAQGGYLGASGAGGDSTAIPFPR